jgi:hypothetical protein
MPGQSRNRQVICKTCGKVFRVYLCRPAAQFCSNICRGKGRSRPLTERFWEKVDRDGPTPPHRPELGPCWIWTAHRHPTGYGGIGGGGRRVGTKRANRVAWELTFGPVPESLFVLHKCDNPTCVRPDHLFVGTPGDNRRDCVAKGRSNDQARGRKGEANRNAKLTTAAVREIRARYAQGGIKQQELAEQYGVTQSIVSKVLLMHSWAHV